MESLKHSINLKARMAACVVRRLVREPAIHVFEPAPSITRQTISFSFRNYDFTVETDYRTPLYETIAEIVNWDCYQLARTDLGSASNGVIIDIGANVGVFTLVASALGSREILAFEPLERNVAALERNLLRNQISKARVIQSAVAASDGKLVLEMDEHISVSPHVINGNASANSFRVDAVGVRTLLAKLEDGVVDLIKIDCEGGEYGIVDQLTKESVRRVRYMTFEVHDKDRTRNFRALWHKLDALGFRILYKPEMFGRRGLHHLLAIH